MAFDTFSTFLLFTHYAGWLAGQWQILPEITKDKWFTYYDLERPKEGEKIEEEETPEEDDNALFSL